MKKEENKPTTLVAMAQHSTPPATVPTAAEVAKELAKLQAKPLPPPPLGKPEPKTEGTATISGTATLEPGGQTIKVATVSYGYGKPVFQPAEVLARGCQAWPRAATTGLDVWLETNH